MGSSPMVRSKRFLYELTLVGGLLVRERGIIGLLSSLYAINFTLRSITPPGLPKMRLTHHMHSF